MTTVVFYFRLPIFPPPLHRHQDHDSRADCPSKELRTPARQRLLSVWDTFNALKKCRQKVVHRDNPAALLALPARKKARALDHVPARGWGCRQTEAACRFWLWLAGKLESLPHVRNGFKQRFLSRAAEAKRLDDLPVMGFLQIEKRSLHPCGRNLLIIPRPDEDQELFQDAGGTDELLCQAVKTDAGARAFPPPSSAGAHTKLGANLEGWGRGPGRA